MLETCVLLFRLEDAGVTSTLSVGRDVLLAEVVVDLEDALRLTVDESSDGDNTVVSSSLTVSVVTLVSSISLKQVLFILICRGVRMLYQMWH